MRTQTKPPAWPMVAQQLGYSVSTCRRKWKSIKDNYNIRAAVQNPVQTPRAAVQNPRSPVDIREEEIDFLDYWNHNVGIDAIDTCSWTWYDWALHFDDIHLYEEQVVNLEYMQEFPFNIINDPRRYGKTTICTETYLKRNLAESLFTGDIKTAYMSAVISNIQLVSLDIMRDFTFNEKILKNYGYLIDERTRKGRKLSKNTMSELTLTTSKSSAPNYTGMKISSRFRGKGLDRCVIDDVVDTEQDQESSYALLTRKVLNNIGSRLIPVCKDGYLSLVGTRYSLRDVFYHLEQDQFWESPGSRKTVIRGNFVDGFSVPSLEDINPDYEENNPDSPRWRKLKASDIIIHDPTEWEILIPQLWSNLKKCPEATAIQNVLHTYYVQGDRIFSCEYQNDPRPLNAVMDYSKFKRFDKLPEDPSYYNWAWFMDDASGEKETSDDRALLLMAVNRKLHQFYIMDMLFFRSIGKKKIEAIVRFDQENEERYPGARIAKLVETVMAQRETHQRLRDEEGMAVQKINPRGRGDKEYRIKNNIIVVLDEDNLWLRNGIRHERKFKEECEGFPHVHVNMLDAADQCLYHLNKRKVGFVEKFRSG